MGTVIDMVVLEMTNQDKGFYQTLGPFIGSREVHTELGGPVYDDPGKRWWVAQSAARVLGFCALTVDGPTAKLGSAYVVPDARNGGVYEALFTARLDAARELGLPLRATVRPAAAKLFRKHGFRASRETTNYVVFELDTVAKSPAKPKAKRRASK